MQRSGYGSFFSSDKPTVEAGTLGALLSKKIAEYKENIPTWKKVLRTAQAEVASATQYAAHLGTIAEIDLAASVLAHVQGKNPPCALSKDFCALLRETLCNYFHITQCDINAVKPNVYKSGIAASPFVDTSLLAKEIDIKATHVVIASKIQNRELRDSKEINNVPMHSMKGRR